MTTIAETKKQFFTKVADFILNHEFAHNLNGNQVAYLKSFAENPVSNLELNVFDMALGVTCEEKVAWKKEPPPSANADELWASYKVRLVIWTSPRRTGWSLDEVECIIDNLSTISSFASELENIAVAPEPHFWANSEQFHKIMNHKYSSTFLISPSDG